MKTVNKSYTYKTHLVRLKGSKVLLEQVPLTEHEF